MLVPAASASAGCHAARAPVSNLLRGSRFTRGGIALRGVSRDRGCGPRGAGQVAQGSRKAQRNHNRFLFKVR
jgi:hypothetical protein